MKKIKAYEEYRDSGIEWIGNIPKDWQVKKIKQRIKSLVTGGTPNTSETKFWTEDESQGIPWVSIADMTSSDVINKTNKYITEEGRKEKNLTILPKGTLLYSIFASLGKTALLNVEATTNQAILGFVFDDKILDQRFLRYYLQDFERSILILSSPNTQENLNTTKIKNLEMPVPKLVEQQKIADFLDDKTKKIEMVMNNKLEQIRLLKKYEQIIINEAVILGLNKGVELKDSGIEWIGNIPKNWKVEKLKYVTDLKFSNVNKKTDVGEKEVLACNYIDVYKNNYITHNIDFMKISASEEEINKFSIKKGDILATKDSEEPEDIAIPSFVLEDFEEVVCGYHLAMIRPPDKFVPKYLFRLFQSRDFNIRFTIFAKGVTRFGLDMNIFKDAKVPMPPISEQQKIADYLDEKTSKIRKSIDIIEKEVEKLEEYKKILINEAVTGKIKVF